jgi:starvation-inducible DNA-binding protein
MNVSVMKDKTKKQIESLSTFLANSYLLLVKTQNFHWNVVGPRFQQLHLLFEEQYEDLQEAIDVIAERLRTLGGKSPGSMQDFIELGDIKESRNDLSEDQMLEILADDHDLIASSLLDWIAQAQAERDEATADLYINRLRVHEKAAWMLRSHFSDS